MRRRPYSPDLLTALRETIRRVAESAGPNDPTFHKLKKLLVLKLAEQESGEPLEATTTDRS
jgi:hypothetical protein